MKRAPVIKNAPAIDINAETVLAASDYAQPVAPAVAKLSDRVRGMSPGNTIKQKVCGRDVNFTLKVIPAQMVSNSTMVWAGNERDQRLLTDTALADLIPSFARDGQQFPAYGRDICGITEVADGSRRRAAAIATQRAYSVLVGNLDDEQMAALSQLGNDYRPTSAYERGKRYTRLLHATFDGNISKLAEAEGISRKIIARCVATAELPVKVIALFSSPNELSARTGEVLAKHFRKHRAAIDTIVDELTCRGEALDTDDIISALYACGASGPKDITVRTFVRTFGAGIKATYRQDGVDISLKKVPDTLLKKIEILLEQHEQEQRELD